VKSRWGLVVRWLLRVLRTGLSSGGWIMGRGLKLIIELRRFGVGPLLVGAFFCVGRG
jgi:hypothetical protein